MRCSVASRTASQAAPASLQILDLDDQDDRIADEDADQRQHAENGDEAQRRVARQQRRDDADQRQRRDGEDQEQPVETLQLDHQDRRHDEQHQRHDGGDRALRLGAFLDRAADHDLVAGRQRLCEFRHLRRELVDHGRRLHCVVDATLTVIVGRRERRQIVGCSSP